MRILTIRLFRKIVFRQQQIIQGGFIHMFPSDSDLETNVTLESERTGVIDEPPFRILMLGDWSGDAEKSDLHRRNPLEIDRDNFDDIMKKLRVRLELELEGGGLTLEFNGLDDFHPDELFKQVPMFADLRDLRRRLNNESTFNSAAREVREWFSVPEKPANVSSSENEHASPADNLLDAILSKPGGGAPPPRQAASSELSSFVSDLVRPHLVAVDENEQAGLTAAVDKATGDLMRKILHHRRFQRLEAAWRGLYFLVRRTETAADLKIYILDVSQAELTDNLKSASGLAETILYRHLIKDAIETPGSDPWSVVCGNYAYEPNVDDIAALMRISKIASPANTPFISHMRPAVIGVSSLADHPDPAEWDLTGGTNEGKLWAALRSQAEAQYLGLTIPRFIARLPYGSETDPLETFLFEEFTDTPVHDDYLWTNSCFAVALLLAQSYSEYGWDFARELIQDIDGLPVHIYEQNGETVFTSCAEVQLSQKACEQLMEYGLMPLVSFKNSDRLRLARFQSITDPVRILKGRWS